MTRREKIGLVVLVVALGTFIGGMEWSDAQARSDQRIIMLRMYDTQLQTHGTLLKILEATGH
jgi:hypothetical protein